MSTTVAAWVLIRPVVEAGVVGHDHHAVDRREQLRRERLGDALDAVLGEALHPRIVVLHVRALRVEQADDVERRALAQVVDVGLVRDADHQHPGALHRAARVVQHLADLADPEERHLGVELAGQVDEPRLVVEAPHLPREVVRIDRDAVAADARAGSEFHEAERLGGRGVDHFPHVHAQLVADDGHFVDQADVHAAEGVLQQLHQLGGLDRRHLHDLLDRRLVERGHDAGAVGGDAAHDLRRVAGVPGRVARIDALGAEGEEEILAHLEPGLLERRLHHFARGPRIRGALEHDRLPGPERGLDRLGGGHDEAHVRILELGERRRHADRDRVRLARGATDRWSRRSARP